MGIFAEDRYGPGAGHGTTYGAEPDTGSDVCVSDIIIEYS